MKKYLVSVALAALAQPAFVTTFPTLTTIYVGSGVLDNGGADGVGTAASLFCTNVSGETANMRVLILDDSGAVRDSTSFIIVHGATETVSTHGTPLTEIDVDTGNIRGVVNVESTQSGVFCRAAVVNAAGPSEDSSPITLVRVNPHPGTVE